jgi:hypothetical protein
VPLHLRRSVGIHVAPVIVDVEPDDILVADTCIKRREREEKEKRKRREREEKVSVPKMLAACL